MHSQALQQLRLLSAGNRNIFSWNICPINLIFPSSLHIIDLFEGGLISAYLDSPWGGAAQARDPCKPREGFIPAWITAERGWWQLRGANKTVCA